MKRHLTTLVSLLAVVAMMFSLASCDLFGSTEEKHEHKFSAEWSKDASGHWKAATCTDTDACKSAKKDSAAHTFAAGKCSVCNYADPDYKPNTPAEGSKENPKALTVPGNITVNYAAGADPVWYKFTADKTDKLGITLSENTTIGYGLNTTDITYVEDETYVEVELTAGTTYYVNFSSTDLEAATITVSAAYVEKIVAGDLTGTYIAASTGTGFTNYVYIHIDTNETLTGGTVTFATDLNGKNAANYTYVVEDDGITISVYNGETNLSESTNDATKVTLTVTKDGLTGAFYDGYARTVAPTSATGFEGEYNLVAGEDASIVVEINSIAFIITTYENGVPVKITIPYTGTLGNFAFEAENADVAEYGIVPVFTDAKLTSLAFDGVTYTLPVVVDGSLANPYVVTDFTSTLAVGGSVDEDFKWYTFTTTEEGVLTITYTTANSWVRLLDGVTVVDIDKTYELISFAYPLEANKTYKLALGIWNDLADGETAPTATLSFTAGKIAVDGDFEKPLGFNYMYNATYTFPAGFADDKYVWFGANSAADFEYTVTFTVPVNVQYGVVGNLSSATNVETVTFSLYNAPTNFYIGIQPVDTSAEVEITVHYESNSAVGTASDKPYTNVDVIAATKIPAEGSTSGMKYYAFTSTKEGYLTITYPSSSSDITLLVNGEDGLEGVAYVSSTETTYTYEIYVGKSYVIGLGGGYPVVGADFEVDVAFVEQRIPQPGEEGKPIEVDVLGTNSYTFEGEFAADSYVWYAYNALDNGTLTITFTNAVNVKYGTDKEALTNISGSSSLVITVESGKNYYVVLQPTTGDTVEFIAEFEYPVGTLLNPNKVTENSSVECSVEEGKTVYYCYTATANGKLTISVSSETETAVIYYGAKNNPSSILAGASAEMRLAKDEQFIFWVAGASNLTVTVNFEADPEAGKFTSQTYTVELEANGAKDITFVATEAGTYIFKTAEGENNAYIAVTFGNSSNNYDYNMYHIVTLAVGDTVNFNVSTYDYAADTIEIVVEKQTA